MLIKQKINLNDCVKKGGGKEMQLSYLKYENRKYLHHE